MRKILILLLALISYNLNAQVYERTVTAKDTLKTKGSFVYGTQIVPVPNISYVEWSVSGSGTPLSHPSGWHKTFVSGDKYMSFSSNYRITWSSAIAIADISETDPVVRAISGIVKATGTNIGAATPNVDYLYPNTAITPNTKTKITYDSKGLVTAGADATTSDIAEGSRLYFTDARVSANADVQAGLLGKHTHANLANLNAVTGYNSGDETRSTILTKMGAAYSGADGYVTKEAFSLFSGKQDALNGGTGLVYSTNGVITYDSNTYLTSLSGAVLTSQVIGQTIGDTDNRLTKLWATDIAVSNIIDGSITGNAATATNATKLGGYYYTHFADSLHKHSVLYQPNGDNGFVYTDNSGQLHIDGNIIQSGSSYTTHAEQIYTNDDYIILRANATAGLGAGEYAGFEAVKYDGVNNGRLVFDNTGIARVGTVGTEQPIATRTESPTDTYLATWNDTYKRLDFIARTTFEPADADLAAIAALSGGTGFLKKTADNTWSLDANTYLTSLSGAVLTDQSTGQTIGSTGSRLTKLWATDITVSNAITGSITGNAATVTNGVYTTGAGTVYVVPNTSVTPATKTKITYDAKGLVTGGADATTADIADSSNKRYVTDAQLVVIGNTSNTNSGDNAVNSLYSSLVTNATHTGAVTGSTALTITDKAVTLAKMNDMATASFIGRNTAGTGVPEVLSATTARTMLALDLLNDQWYTSYDYAGNVVNLFKISKDNVMEFGPKLGVNAFYDVLNSGFHDIVNIPVSAASADGTKHGVGVTIGGTRIFDLSMLSDGAGGVDTGLLTLLGKTSTTTFQMTYGAVNGYTMFCDASGNAYWAAASIPYKGTWNAATNSPTIADATGTAGDWYRTATAGTWNSITFAVGDDVYYNGSIWQKITGVGYTLQTASPTVLGGIKIGAGITMTGDVASVSTAYDAAGTTATHAALTTSAHSLGASAFHADAYFVAANSAITGATKTKITYDAKGLVTAGADATTTDIAEGTNLYYTDVRVAANSAVAANTAKVTNATHTGDVTGATALTIAANAVTVAKMQQITTASFLGRITASTGNIEVLSVANVQSMLGLGTAAYTASGDYATAGHNHTGVYQPLATVLTNTTAAYTTALDTKLGGIAAGAEVNVNADWGAVSGDAQILNKPSIPTSTSDLTNGAGYITSSALSGYSTTSHNHTLDALSNVTITTKATGDLIKWNGSAWVNFAPTYVTASELAAYGYLTTDVKWNGGSTGLVAATGRTSLGLGTAAVANLGTGAGDAAYGNHNHSGVYMPYVTANSGYNLNTGTTAGTVATGDHNHTGVYQPIAAVLTNTTASYTTALDTKLSGIAAGAEVNVNADWNAASGDAFIYNKPTIPTTTSQLTNNSGYITTADLTGYSTTAHNHTLDGLSNVNMTGKATGDLVKWSGTAWVPFTPNYVTGTPWTSMGYVTGTPWTSMGYLTTDTKWDGGTTGLNVTTARTSLGLGTAALNATGDFATASHTHSTYVPYTGATGNVTLGTYEITASDFILYSDRSMKENITKIGTDTKGFQFYSFNFLGREGLRYGPMADEVQQTNPEMVHVDEQTGKLKVSYIDMLIKEVSDLKTRVAELEKR